MAGYLQRRRTYFRSGPWRKRVGVEPTPEPAKDTGNGFEGHEDHRAPFASAIRARIIAQGFSWLASPRLVSRPLPFGLVLDALLSSAAPQFGNSRAVAKLPRCDPCDTVLFVAAKGVPAACESASH